MKKLAYILGSGLGSGYVPAAPGTAASFAALVLYALIPVPDQYWLMITLFFVPIGLWSSSVMEKDLGKDPPRVVIDEWVGQWLTVLFLPREILPLTAGFIAFRMLDIVKPFPARGSQKLKGGLGIMIDDIIVAVYGNIILQILFSIRI
jgi:phosphatidylglycerophosphatase A